MPDKIIIKGARVNNLKNINVAIPRDKLVVITGLSGSGKSSLAFDTIYAEGQRRYVESLAAYARQFLGLMDKPDVDSIEGLSPTIAIDQRAVSHNPRSTVGTVTEIYDYLRLFFSKIGRPHCPHCGKPIFRQSAADIGAQILKLGTKGNILILVPILRHGVNVRRQLEKLNRLGYLEGRLNKQLIDIKEVLETKLFKKEEPHDLEVVIGRCSLAQAKCATPATQPIAEYLRVSATAKETQELPLAQLVEIALDFGNGTILVSYPEQNLELTFSQQIVCSECNFVLPDLELRSFSFNSPYGACPACRGLGVKLELDPLLVIPNQRLTLRQGAIKPWMRTGLGTAFHYKILGAVAKAHRFSLDTAVQDLTPQQQKIVFGGTGPQKYVVDKQEIVFNGILADLQKKYEETDSDYLKKEIENYMRPIVCSACRGKRLKPEILAVTVAGQSIADITAWSVSAAKKFFQDLLERKPAAQTNAKTQAKKNFSWTAMDLKISQPILKEIIRRLGALENVGLEYLNIDRATATLSGGETQRVRLATQINSSLTGVIYILDEPSIGLHPRDMEKLIKTLKQLRDMGNTVIVVEHDAITMNNADFIIDIGPGAGQQGGEIVAVGPPAVIKKNKKSLTGLFLDGKLTIEAPGRKQRTDNKKNLFIRGAAAFNLKDIDVKIPLGQMVCVTGVSGSGKSTLVIEILAKALMQKFSNTKELPGSHQKIEGIEHLDKVVIIDQEPIGRTPRSNPATFTGVFTYIRDLFTQLPEAKLKNYDAGQFSFNVKDGGRCPGCAGEGAVKIEMEFLAPVYVECEECHGRRYTAVSLEIYYQGKNIADVLDLSVSEAKEFFADQQVVKEKLEILEKVGLGYIKLGQPATTLSGGEAQRVKLATELSRRPTGRTIYILDEPTTGLHFDDIKKLLLVLNELVEKGNTVLIIEHNPDVIKCADWVIDLGPDGGERGGYLVAAGSPAEIAKTKTSFTGQYLKNILKIKKR